VTNVNWTGLGDYLVKLVHSFFPRVAHIGVVYTNIYMILHEETDSKHAIYTILGCLCCDMLWMPKKMFPQAKHVHGTITSAAKAIVPWTCLAYGKIFLI
jgi:hypothetical protein